jgi:hypothetical protein
MNHANVFSEELRGEAANVAVSGGVLAGLLEPWVSPPHKD